MAPRGVMIAVAALTLMCRVPEAAAQSPIQLHDVTAESGITFRHDDGSSGHRYIIETVSAGLALFDYDLDGDIDIYFLNGAPLGDARRDQTPKNALYRNDGNWHFTDVSEEAHVADRGFGLGVAVGDYDSDGDPDLYVNNYGPNVLYRNNGDGTFTDCTEAAGVANGDKVGAGASFLDIEGDGDLDLFVANYVKFTYDNHVLRHVRGLPMYSGPRDYEAWPDALYRNNGDGTFTDVSVEAGITLPGSGMGMVCLDFDDDADTDVYVCNDVRGNFLFQNDGKGRFQDVGLIAGIAFNMYGQENGSMGIDCGDYNNDGRLDLFMTDYQGELPVLFENLGNGMFDDATLRTGAGAGAMPYVTWGVGFADFDNDGDRDIYFAAGHIQDNIEQADDRTAYKIRNFLMMNVDGKRFVDVSASSGDGMLPVESSRGAAFDDLDNDGDIDAVILNSRQLPTILRNDSPNDHHWLQLRVQGVTANRDGVGAKVTVVAGDLVQVAEVHSGRGYQGHFGSRLHFGLGNHDHVDQVEIRWVGGKTDRYENVPIDQLVTLTEQAN